MPVQSSSTSVAEGTAPAPPSLRADAARDALVTALVMVSVAAAVVPLAGFSAWYPIKAGVLFAVAVGVLRLGLAAHPHHRFGAANRLTLGRLAMVMLLAAVIGEPLRDPAAIAWAIVVFATATAVLDAADGPLARASGLASEFGARFDMETDALLMLVLCGLIVQFDKAGPWVLAVGLMRYAFVAAARPWPWLARPLPPSLRRKTVCVVQITGLIVCLGPVIPRAWSAALAGAGLLILGHSFAADIRWLARARHQPLEVTA